MSSSAQVRWDLLPHDPRGFFQLEAAFDRKALKRAYSQLIRTYKPETHPEQFQKIRAAYEQLELELRYGNQQKLHADQSSAWNQAADLARRAAQEPTAHQADTSETPTPRPAAPAPESVSITELAIADPKAAYQRLGSSKQRTPQDCYALAILSGVLENGDPDNFVKWLLTGIKSQPNDPGMIALLREFFTTDATVQQAPSLLASLSKLVPSHIFFRISEELWKRLLNELPFDRFAKLLDACEQNLRPGPYASTLAFYLQILKRAIFKATPEWADTVFAKLNVAGSELDDVLDLELEFLRAVWDYRIKDRETVRQLPMGPQFDYMIESYCVFPWYDAMKAVINIQDQIARNSHGLIDSISPIPNESSQRLVHILGTIGSDVAEQMGLEYHQSDTLNLQVLADRVIVEIDNKIPALAAKFNRARFRHNIIPFAVIYLAPVILFSAFLSLIQLFLFAAVWLAFSILIGKLVIQHWWENRFDDRAQSLLVNEYEQHWRPRLLRYMQSSCAHPRDALQALFQSGAEVGEYDMMGLVYNFAREDPALPIFGLSQLYIQ